MEHAGEWRQGFREDQSGRLVLDAETRIFVPGQGPIAEDLMVQQTLLASRIHREYARLEELRYGWTFCASSGDRIFDAEVAIIGLNPGGGDDGNFDSYREIWDREDGNGYFEEHWGSSGGNYSPLQLQVQAWHEMLQVEPEETLCAQFVPFRSSSWASLPRKDVCLSFSIDLWRDILFSSPAKLIVCMGKLPARYLARLLEATAQLSYPIGWGRQRIDVWQTMDGRRVVGMPHPGHFALFGRNHASAIAETNFLLATGRGPSVA